MIHSRSDVRIERIPTPPSTPYPLGRHIHHDERSKTFRISAPPLTELKTIAHRRHGFKLDQGSLGSCCGHASVHALNTDPYRAKRRPNKTYRHEDALAIYSRATQLDPWAGSWPPADTGTNGLSVCKAMMEKGYITSYKWAFGFNEGLNAIANGPLLQGTVWYSSMYSPDASGRVRLDGRKEGGHEYVWIGIEIVGDGKNYSKNRSWFFNSWSGRWGKGGYFWMTFSDHARLLEEDGDLVQPITT